MVLQILCDALYHSHPVVPASEYILRIDIELFRDIRDIPEIGCKEPIVERPVEIGLGGIPLPYLFLDIHSPVIIVQEIVHPADILVCIGPDGIYLGCLGGVVARSDSPVGGIHCPWGTVRHNFCHVQPVLALQRSGEGVGYTGEMLFRLPEIGICDLVPRRTVQKIIIAGHCRKCRDRQNQSYMYLFHWKHVIMVIVPIQM